MEPTESKHHTPNSQITNMGDLPFVKGIGVLALLCAFLWGSYYEFGQLADVFPVGMMSFMNGFGFFVYSTAALLSASIAASILYKGWRMRFWTEYESNFFNGTATVAFMFLFTGLQLVMVESERYYNAFFFFFGKLVLCIFLIRFILKVSREDRKQNPDNGATSVSQPEITSD
jgi:hypothetical protein